MQTNPAVKRSKIIRWSESPWNQSSRKGKGLWKKGFFAFSSQHRPCQQQWQHNSAATWCYPAKKFSN